MFDPYELIGALAGAGVDYVVIGGFAVGAHGFPRATKDLDIVPAPDAENLRRLAGVLRDLGAVNYGTGDFDRNEFPFDPFDPRELKEGGNFLLLTHAGRLDVMQWVPGIEADHAYGVLDADAIEVPSATRAFDVRWYISPMKTSLDDPRTSSISSICRSIEVTRRASVSRLRSSRAATGRLLAPGGQRRPVAYARYAAVHRRPPRTTTRACSCTRTYESGH